MIKNRYSLPFIKEIKDRLAGHSSLYVLTFLEGLDISELEKGVNGMKTPVPEAKAQGCRW
jgi:hypothetical protein